MEEPGNVFARDQLATSHRKIADLRKLDGDDVAAGAIYVKAVDLGQKLHTAEPTNSEVKLHLALALDDYAMTLRRLGLLEEASPLDASPNSFLPSSSAPILKMSTTACGSTRPNLITALWNSTCSTPKPPRRDSGKPWTA